MPNYKTHLLAGFICFIGGMILTKNYFQCLQLPFDLIPLACLLTLLGSIFPDIDIKSKMQRLFYFTVALLFPLLLLARFKTSFVFGSFIAFLIPGLAHRTLTHRPLFLIAMPLCIAAYISHAQPLRQNPHELALAIFFMLGALSHVILDTSMSRIKKFFCGVRYR